MGLVTLGIGETSAQQQQRRKAPPVAQGRPAQQRAEHQARAAARCARVGGGRRVRAQHRGHVELQRHRDRHLRRHRRQPAAQRRVRASTMSSSSWRAFRAGWSCGARAMSPASGSTPPPPPSTTCRATTPSPPRVRSTRSRPRSSARCMASACKHLKFTPAVGQSHPLSNEDIKEYRDAIMRLKRKDGLYLDRPVRRDSSPARASSAPASCCQPTSPLGRSTRACTCSARRSC